MGLPTLIFFRDGAEAERYTGLLEYDELRRKVEQLLAAKPTLTIQPLSAIHSHFISSSSEQSAMRMSKLFFQTLREAADAEIASHQLLLRQVWSFPSPRAF